MKEKYTTLHFAASMRNIAMCKVIASINPLIVGTWNLDSETPIFLVTLLGRRESFLCLHYNCTPTNCRRNDGDIILHHAIVGDYFGNLLSLVVGLGRFD